jgi:hypothetical protein
MIPPAAISLGYAGLMTTGTAPPGASAAMALAAGLGCVGGISAMSNQESSRCVQTISLQFRTVQRSDQCRTVQRGFKWPRTAV